MMGRDGKPRGRGFGKGRMNGVKPKELGKGHLPLQKVGSLQVRKCVWQSAHTVISVGEKMSVRAMNRSLRCGRASHPFLQLSPGHTHHRSHCRLPKKVRWWRN